MKYWNMFIAGSLALTVPIAGCGTKISNQKSATVRIEGNCGMCKKNIEQAAWVKHVALAEWDKTSQQAIIKYDSTRTSLNEVLKRIALAGYDNESYLAPQDAYLNLDVCCQYERGAGTSTAVVPKPEEEQNSVRSPDPLAISSLTPVYDAYFELKDALVNSDGVQASEKAKKLTGMIEQVKMEALTAKEHKEWMAVYEALAFEAGHIADTRDVTHQRDHFATLSEKMHQLFKTSAYAEPVYEQHCPMFNKGKGANWLSRDPEIKNPYYGAAMMGCGSTKGIIQP